MHIAHKQSYTKQNHYIWATAVVLKKSNVHEKGGALTL